MSATAVLSFGFPGGLTFNPQDIERNNMANAHASLQITITFTQQEFRLVTMGLAGIIKDTEDAKDARQLNTKLCHQRVMEVDQVKREADRALENASALQNPNVPPFKPRK